jgi:hypothetical protein
MKFEGFWWDLKFSVESFEGWKKLYKLAYI